MSQYWGQLIYFLSVVGYRVKFGKRMSVSISNSKHTKFANGPTMSWAFNLKKIFFSHEGYFPCLLFNQHISQILLQVR